MSEQAGASLEPEPQSERGEPGSRDTGSDEPEGGPVSRPSGGSDEETDTSVNPQSTDDDGSPDLPSGSG